MGCGGISGQMQIHAHSTWLGCSISNLSSFFLGVLWMLRYVGKQLYCIQTSSQPSSKDQILQELGLR